jgi:hypothetical protein
VHNKTPPSCLQQPHFYPPLFNGAGGCLGYCVCVSQVSFSSRRET